MRTSNTNYNHFWKTVVRTQDHMNGTDVINTLNEGGGNWGHDGREALNKNVIIWERLSYLVEQQNYVSENKNYSVGYVKNRTYNIKTMGCSAITFKDNTGFSNPKSIPHNKIRIGDTISIISLKNLTYYYVNWYSYNTGTYIKTDYKKTSYNGTLKLKFPELTFTNPVLWFVVHQDAYSGLMQTEAPLAEREATLFEFRSIGEDTTSINFQNSVYPNPFRNEIIVNSLDDDNLIIKTLDGKIIYQQEINRGKNRIILENLSNGLYLCELEKQGFITKLEKR